jgi:hypothetical protein
MFADGPTVEEPTAELDGSEWDEPERPTERRERTGRVSGVWTQAIRVCLPSFPRLTSRHSVFAVFLFRI